MLAAAAGSSVILRGWFGVERENWINDIDCRDINMTPKTDGSIDLRRPSISRIKLKPNKASIIEIENTKEQPRRVTKTLDISVESSLKYSYSDKDDIKVVGELYFPKEMYYDLFAEEGDSMVEVAVKLKYAISSYKDGFKNLTVNGMDRRTFTFYINYTNCGKLDEDRISFRSVTGDSWYSGIDEAYDKNFERIEGKRWQRTGEKSIEITDPQERLRRRKYIKEVTYEIRHQQRALP